MCARSRSACASARRAQRQQQQQTVLRRVLPSPVASLLQALPAQQGPPARAQGLGTRLAVSAPCWCLTCTVKEGLTFLGCRPQHSSAKDNLFILWIACFILLSLLYRSAGKSTHEAGAGAGSQGRPAQQQQPWQESPAPPRAQGRQEAAEGSQTQMHSPPVAAAHMQEAAQPQQKLTKAQKRWAWACWSPTSRHI